MARPQSMTRLGDRAGVIGLTVVLLLPLVPLVIWAFSQRWLFPAPLPTEDGAPSPAMLQAAGTVAVDPSARATQPATPFHSGATRAPPSTRRPGRALWVLGVAAVVAAGLWAGTRLLLDTGDPPLASPPRAVPTGRALVATAASVVPAVRAPEPTHTAASTTPTTRPAPPSEPARIPSAARPPASLPPPSPPPVRAGKDDFPG